MRSYRPVFFFKWLFPDILFRRQTEEKVLCLTFDDGPSSGSTLPILDILSGYNVKATFFCNGGAALHNKELIDRIREEGHVVGNHGFNHLNGLWTPDKEYLEDVMKASLCTSAHLFRPPYGKMRFSQYLKLRKLYRIVLWDIMAYDFDAGFGSERSLKVLKKMIRPGSVIVLHDTQKSSAREILDPFLKYAISKGYRFIFP